MNLDDINVTRDVKIVFMGTPMFAVPVLEGLIEKYKVRAVVTQPDRPVGRTQEKRPSPVKQVALKNTILVLQPESLKEQFQEVLDLEPDLIITCAYGQILPKEIIKYPRLGCINVHASLLPRLRGAAPIHKAIIDGFSKTGVTLMYMSMGLDEGDIITSREVEIKEDDTASSLHDKLSIVGRDLLLDTLPSIIDKTCPRVKQDHSIATYALSIKREDEHIDFEKSKRQVYNLVRGLNSWPGAYCMFEGKILKVWECYPTDEVYSEAFNGQITKIYKDGFGVKVANGEVVLTKVQPEGKNKMSAIDFINGVGKEKIIGKVLD